MKLEWSGFQLLSEDNVKKYVPTSAGVYLLWVRLQNEKWSCYYVGQAENLEKRLFEHLSASEENQCIKNNVANHISGYECSKVPVKTNRDGVEKFLFDHFKPECNKVDPGGTPIEANIP